MSKSIFRRWNRSSGRRESSFWQFPAFAFGDPAVERQTLVDTNEISMSRMRSDRDILGESRVC